jgi:hypothetical protein
MSKKIIVIDKTGETDNKPKRRGKRRREKTDPAPRESIVPEDGPELHPRTRNKILRQLAAEARRIGGSCVAVRCSSDHVGDVVVLAPLLEAIVRLKEIEKDAIKLGYKPDRFAPATRGAFLSGLIETLRMKGRR